jgi:hypothetical protein
MASSPRHRQRRNASVRRRRAFALAGLVGLAVAAGVWIYVATRAHHVVVVRVVTSKAHGGAAQAQRSREYPAARGAPSLDKVRAELAATEHSGAAASTDSAHGSALVPGARDSFTRLASSLPGQIQLAVAPLAGGSDTTLGGDEAAHGWSTTKIPVLAALLKARGTGGLTPSETTLARSAITESSNESILALFADLERLKGGLAGASSYVQRLFRVSGDQETVVATAPPPPGAATTFGQTEWKPSEAARFFRALALGCLLPPRATGYVLGLMQEIVPGESWGLGSAGFRSVAFKGGWGPERSGGYLVRQSGVIDPESSAAVAVAIVARPSSGSFAVGTQMLTRAAVWLRHELAHRAGSGGECA